MNGLYRGKRKDNGEWIEGYYVESNYYEGGKCYFIIETDNQHDDYCSFHGYVYDVIPETVCKCLNLPDKNGKQIFQGDILRRVLRNANETDFVYTVEWCKECAMFVLPCVTYEPGESDFSVFNSTDFEVIGNIYDDLELLIQNY